MKKKNGFTLVELLAVIVILAVVILIAVTAVIPRMNSARKNAFADEALAYIKAAKEANVEGQMGGGDGGTCFTIDYLNQNYIDKKSDSYEGFVAYDSEDDTWKAYIKSDKYMINGAGGKLSKANVADAGELDEAPSGCVGGSGPVGALCKRATTLHTETCDQPSGYCAGNGYSTGGTITYGNLGSGSTLTTGDAFDCDVNGDGTYNASNERFYYLTDMNSNTAVMVYWSNVTGGVADNTTSHAHGVMPTYPDKAMGPSVALVELPTTSQWSNVTLTNTSRNITDETGAVREAGFSYAGYAARLMTYDEINAGCYDGSKSISSTGGLHTKCKFLYENTMFAKTTAGVQHTYLETVNSSVYNIGYAYNTGSGYVMAFPVSGQSQTSVRPVIEVSKSSIEL